MLAFDHLRHEVTVLANVLRRGRPRTGLRDARPPRSPTCASGWPRRCPACAAGRREAPGLHLEHRLGGYAAAVERAKEYIRAGDVYQVVPSQRWSARGAGRRVLDLSRPADRQPEPVHVLPRLRGLRAGRRLARVARQGQRPPRRAAADRRHAAACPHDRGGRRARQEPARRREGARRARDAGRPRPQRPRPGLRVRLRERRRADGRRDVLPRHAHRQLGLRHAARRT